MDLESILGGSKKTPPNAKFPKVGTVVKIILTEDAEARAVREFTNGVPGEQLFFQGKKVVRQSDLNANLHFEPVPQILLVGKTQEGEEVSIWADGNKLKALRAACREAGYHALKAGTGVAMEFSSEENPNNAPFPKKVYTAQVRPPKG